MRQPKGTACRPYKSYRSAAGSTPQSRLPYCLFINCLSWQDVAVAILKCCDVMLHVHIIYINLYPDYQQFYDLYWTELHYCNISINAPIILGFGL